MMKRYTYVSGVVEAEVTVETSDLAELGLGEVEVSALKVLEETLGVIGFGDDSETALSRPSEEDLGGGAIVSRRDLGNEGVFEEGRGILSLVPVELDEGRGTESERRRNEDNGIVSRGIKRTKSRQ